MKVKVYYTMPFSKVVEVDDKYLSLLQESNIALEELLLDETVPFEAVSGSVWDAEKFIPLADIEDL